MDITTDIAEGSEGVVAIAAEIEGACPTASQGGAEEVTEEAEVSVTPTIFSLHTCQCLTCIILRSTHD